MKTLKTRQLLSLVFSACFFGFISGVDLDPCFPAVINGPCNITCRVPDTSQLIKINCNGNTQGSCSTFGCSTNMFQEGGNTVFLAIRSLSYSETCNWTCSHGSDTSLPSELTVFSGFYNGNPSLTYQRDGDLVKLTATAECIYPSNLTVNVQYKDQGGEYLNLTEQQVILQYSNVPGVCGFAYENRTTAKSDVSGKLKELDGKRIYFKMRFSQYDSAILPYYSNEVGPISFEDCSQDIFLYGFLPVFLIVLIASIPINILKIDFLSKQFGEFTWKKVGITAVFFVIAIIIGVCLGLLIKGCDKKLLALGLSLFFGILLVVALIFALIYYHKKCESGSGS